MRERKEEEEREGMADGELAAGLNYSEALLAAL